MISDPEKTAQPSATKGVVEADINANMQDNQAEDTEQKIPTTAKPKSFMELLRAAQDKSKAEKELNLEIEEDKAEEEVVEDENEVQAYFSSEAVEKITKKQRKDYFSHLLSLKQSAVS